MRRILAAAVLAVTAVLPVRAEASPRICAEPAYGGNGVSACASFACLNLCAPRVEVSATCAVGIPPELATPLTVSCEPLG